MIPKRYLDALTAAQKKLGVPFYLVGGAVRDALIPAPCLDFDLALPSGSKKAAEAFAHSTGGRLVKLDDERHIFRVVVREKEQSIQFDFADFEGKTIEEDLSRRDFTLNAMAVPLSGIKRPASALTDPFGGLKDLMQRTLRAVSEKNLKDDPLRLLRAYRFASTLDFKIEKRTLGWIKRNAKKIRRPAAERIRFELMQIMQADNAAQALKAMDETRLLTALYPVLDRSRNLARQYYKRGGVLGHMLDSVECFEENARTLKRHYPKMAKKLREYLDEMIGGGFPRLAALKLAVLFHDVAKPHCAKKIKGRLRFFGHDEKGADIWRKIGTKDRFSGDEVDLIAKVIRAHLRPGNLSEQPEVSDRATYRFFRDLGPDGVGVLLCALSDHQSYIVKKNRWNPKEKSISVIGMLLTRYYQESKKVVPPKLITGHDVMKILNLQPGPHIGKILDNLRSAQAEGKVITREQALEFIKK